jgi:cyclopropane-fatty-acyl-phospholipid synthase
VIPAVRTQGTQRHRMDTRGGGRGLGPFERGLVAFLGSRIRLGRLAIVEPDGRERVFTGRGDGPHARLEIHDGRFLRRLLATGAIALADSYVAGEYDSDDLASFIELMALHMEPEQRVRVPGWLERSGRATWRRLGGGERPRGPLEDVVQHYDLGNDFYAAWLDPTMTYSSAYFARDEMSLHEAQQEKYRRLAVSAGLRPGERVLEIGSGWGGFAVYLASELNARVTTVTVSREQADHVERLIAERGLADRVEVRVEDFAAVTGRYDRAVSVEMIESIPGRRWGEYLDALRERVVPGGTIGLQVITVADHHWRSSNTNPDFIRRYVFPGGQVPAPKILDGLAARAGLDRVDRVSFGSSYARTLRSWRERFEENWETVIAPMGFDDRFRRMWRYYLAYCEGGFRAGRVDVSQVVLARP